MLCRMRLGFSFVREPSLDVLLAYLCKCRGSSPISWSTWFGDQDRRQFKMIEPLARHIKDKSYHFEDSLKRISSQFVQLIKEK